MFVCVYPSSFSGRGKPITNDVPIPPSPHSLILHPSSPPQLGPACLCFPLIPPRHQTRPNTGMEKVVHIAQTYSSKWPIVMFARCINCLMTEFLLIYEEWADQSLVYKENKLRDWKKCIYSTYSPMSFTHLWLRCSNCFNLSKKNSLGCAANKEIWSRKAKDLSARLRIKFSSYLTGNIEPNRLTPFRETVAVYCENHTRSKLCYDRRSVGQSVLE
jgi:hypothetical protein